MELDRQRDAKTDLIGDTRRLAVRPVIEADRDMPQVMVDHKLIMQINGEAEAPINDLALTQIGQRLQIPAKYVNRLAGAYPDLLSTNINALFSREPEKRMIRMLDGRVRAFLSDRYRVIDHFDTAQIVLKLMQEYRAEIESCEVTEGRMYIKASLPDLVAEIPPPPGVEKGKGHTMFVDKVKGGMVITNSEVGLGSYQVAPATVTEMCSNLAVFRDRAFRQMHLGKKQGDGSDQFREYLSDETRQAEDATLFMRIRDVTKAAMDGRIFNDIVAQLTETRGREITKPVAEFVEVGAKRFGLLETEAAGIMEHLIKGGDFTQYGAHAAVTRFSQDVDNYDRASDLENIGGEIIRMDPSEWTTLAVKKAA